MNENKAPRNSVIESIRRNYPNEKGSNFYDLVLGIEGHEPLNDEEIDKFGLRGKNLPIIKKDNKEEVISEYFDLIHDKKFNEASEVLAQYVLSRVKIYTTKNDIKTEMWIYDDGIYVPNGKSEVKIIIRELLGKWYSMFVVNQVLSKIEADTFIESDEFFNIKYPNEIVVKNGILNIFSLELSPYTSNKIFFTKFNVFYNPDAECPKIEKFLKDVLANPDDIQVFYEIGGFGLLKEYKFEKSFMFVGNGRNGKGKAIEILKRTYGMENCCSIPLANLTSDSFSVSGLFGKHLNLAGDIGNKDLKDTSMFKSLTGRDLIGGKRKFLPDLNFINYAKFVFACNELPMVYDISKGFWDRWILLDFPYTFVTQYEYDNSIDKTNLKLRDDDIIEKITTDEELSGFLNECLNGLARLIHNKKFSTTRGSNDIKLSWIRNANSCMAFCLDFIEENYEGKIKKKDFRKRYSEYCKHHKLRNKSDLIVKNVLQEMFGAGEIRILEDYQQEHYWDGIKWKGII